jgi:hypothetical protein
MTKYLEREKNLREERFILTHGFRGFSPSCQEEHTRVQGNSHHGGQEGGERERLRERERE